MVEVDQQVQEEVQLSKEQEDLVDELPNLIKIFHLTNGNIVIGVVDRYSSEYALLWKPCNVVRVIDAMGELVGFELTPYLAYLLDEDEIIPLNLKNTFSVVSPIKDLMTYYIGNCLIPNDNENDEQEMESSVEEIIQEEEQNTTGQTRKRIVH